MTRRFHITVMLGGPSAEREVSLRSGAAVGKALSELGHQVSFLDPGPGGWVLPAGTDLVYLALHGTYGEDGSVQAELERLGVPYTGCGPEASAVAFDKVATKERCIAALVPTPRFLVISAPGTPWPADWNPPVVMKPVCQGSSVGLHFVDQREQWADALRDCLQFGPVLVEERILGRETTVGILADEPLPIVEVRPKRGAYDYHNKYTLGATEYFCPADFSSETAARIQQAALGAFRCVGGRDYGRVDVMVGDSGDPLVLEVNTLPGMTETSLLPKAAAAAGISYPELCQRMIDLAASRVPKNKTDVA